MCVEDQDKQPFSHSDHNNINIKLPLEKQSKQM